MSLTIITQREFYESMKAYLIANQTKITDLNSGSALDTQLNAMATQLNQSMTKASGGFKSQFEQIAYNVFDFQRKDESFSSGTVVFSRQNADLVQIDIPIGTIVSTTTGITYTTQNQVSILSGATDSSAANITADEAGVTSNVLVGEISVINSSVDGINSVTNNTATSGGADVESNSEYFTRFTNYILGLAGSNGNGVLTAATTVATIISGFVEDHFPPESGLYNFTIYVDDGSGSVPQDTLDEIELKLRGNNTSDYPGYVAAGINFRVMSAGLVPIAVEYTAQIDPLNTNAIDIKPILETVIKNYVDNLWVGKSVIRAELIRLVQGTGGVVNVTVMDLNGSDTDVIITSSQVARVSTITPTITT